MNNNGQTMIFGIMLFVLAFIVAVILIPPLRGLLDEVRGQGSLSCGNTNLTTGEAATCVIVDLILPFFILTVLIVGIAMIGNRITSGGSGGY